MIFQTICIFVNVLWSDTFHCLDVLPACKRWNLRTLSFAGSATVPSFTSLENNISINQHTKNHSNVFVFKPNAIIDWNAINNSDFAKSTNMLKIDNILSNHLSLAGSLRRFASQNLLAVPDVALGPCLGQSRVLVVVLNWWRNFGIVRSGNKIDSNDSMISMIDVKSGQIRWNHVKPCQIMSKHVKHVKCNVEIRRTYVFKGWICLPFLYNFQLRHVPCTLRPSTLSCRTTVILIACFLCWPNRLLQSVPGKQNSGSSFVAHFIFWTSWLQIDCFESGIALLIAMSPFVAKLCVILVVV